MKVTMEKSCAARINGVAKSLAKDSEHDLADKVAQQLVKGGYASEGWKSEADSEPSQPAPDPEPEPEAEAEEKSADDAPENKDAGSAPENKTAAKKTAAKRPRKSAASKKQ